MRVHGGGFVTRAMLEQAINGVLAEPASSSSILVDLREVAGYEAACLRPAHDFLRQAASKGLTRIALVASSSVMRTASRMAASAVSVELRTFAHEPTAKRWLHGQQD